MVRKRSSQVIVSAVLGEEKYLELVRAHSDSTALLVWDGRKASTNRKLSWGTQTYVAADFGSDLPREIRLAKHLSDYQSAGVLVEEIADIFRTRAGVTQSDAELAAFFAIATHFSDCQDPALRGIVGAADEWDGSRFLQLLACFCRHALPLAIFDKAQLCRLPPGCVPTVVISHTKPSKGLIAFLNATQHQGFALAHAGQTASRPFSAVILDCDRGLGGLAPSSFCRIDATPRTQPELPNAQALRNIEDKFQSRLLSYRLQHRSQVARATFAAGGLGGSTRALASVLGSCFPNNENLQARACKLLKPQDEDRRFDSACGEPAVVLEALLVLCHRDKNEIHVGEVTEIANGILDLRGDGYQLNPRRVGALLKPFRLGHTRDSKGYKFLLSAGNKRRIHELGRSYDVSFFKGEIQQCSFCHDSAARVARRIMPIGVRGERGVLNVHNLNRGPD
jgi:hypothetical protein